MKNYKKIFSLSFAVLLLFSIASVTIPSIVSAKVATSAAQIQNATFEFKHRGLIVAKIGDQTVNFVDSNPFDYGLKYVAQGDECESYIGDEEKMDEKFALTSLGNYPGSLNTDWIHIKYDNGAGNGCKEAKPSKWPGGVDVGMRTWFNWVDAGTLEIVDGSRVFKKTGDNDYYLYTGENGENCQDRVFLNTVTSRAGDNTRSVDEGNSGKYFELDKDGELNPKDTDAKNLNLGSCEITGFNFLDSISGEKAFNNYYKNSFSVGAVANRGIEAGKGKLANGQTSGATGSDVNADACDLTGFTLNWIFCPVINAIDEIFDGINIVVESRLTINTNEFLTPQIKRTWDIFRVLATSMLVIIMLVMIISQAIGTGVFDAYTVRKVLPRLVVAAILIQLSWEMFIWVITLANNAGNGLYNLIAIPFGGREELALNHLIGSLGNAAPGATTLIGAMFAAGIAVFNPFLILLVAFMIIMAVLTAAATLLFREILILACVILGPLALLAWILPGTNRYWKMWWENFTKALLIFPLIMGLLAIGRVFAWITANGGGTPGMFDWFAVLIGFFLPYYLLPKTFRWGGTLMSSAGSAISGAMKPISSFGNKEIRDAGQRYQGKWAKDYNNEGKMWETNKRERKIWGRKEPLKYTSPLGGRAIRRFQSGHFLPTKRSQSQATLKGDKWNSEQEEMANSVLKRGGEKSMTGYDRVVRDEDSNILVPKMNADGTKYLDKDGEETDDMSRAASGGLATSAQIAAYNAAQEIKNDDERKAAIKASGVHVVTATGTDAMKSYWVDKSEDSDKVIAKMAERALLDTSSYPELEGRFTKSGVRVVDLPNWSRNITTSSEHYKATLRGRTSSAPHIKDSAKKRVSDLYGIDYDTDIPKMLKSSNSADIDKAQEIIRVAHAHSAGYAINDQLDNEDFRGLSDGEWNGYRRAVMTKDGKLRGKWDENGQPRVVNGVKDAEAEYVLSIRNGLRNRFKAIHDAGPTAAQSMLGALKNGGDKERNINMILGAGMNDPSTASLDAYLNFERDSPGAPTFSPEDSKKTQKQEHPEFKKASGDGPSSPSDGERPDDPDAIHNYAPSDNPASGLDPRRYSGHSESASGPGFEGVGPGMHEQRSSINTAARAKSGRGLAANEGEVLAVPHNTSTASSEPPVLVMPTVAISDEAAENIGKAVATSAGEAIKKQLESSSFGSGSIELPTGNIVPPQSPSTPTRQQAPVEGTGAQQKEVVEELRSLRRQIREMPSDKRDPESQIMLEKIEREHPEFNDEDKPN